MQTADCRKAHSPSTKARKRLSRQFTARAAAYGGGGCRAYLPLRSCESVTLSLEPSVARSVVSTAFIAVMLHSSSTGCPLCRTVTADPRSKLAP